VEELSDFEIDRINSYIEIHVPNKEAVEDVAVYMESLLGKFKIKNNSALFF